MKWFNYKFKEIHHIPGTFYAMLKRILGSKAVPGGDPLHTT